LAIERRKKNGGRSIKNQSGRKPELEIVERTRIPWLECSMATVPFEKARGQVEELARRVEQGETIVVTREGKPVFDLVPHRKKGGIDFEAGRAYLRSLGIKDPFPYVAEDFDGPLPEDFLIKPLPFD
jgi:prevent-host-death family protein